MCEEEIPISQKISPLIKLKNMKLFVIKLNFKIVYL